MMSFCFCFVNVIAVCLFFMTSDQNLAKSSPAPFPSWKTNECVSLFLHLAFFAMPNIQNFIIEYSIH